MTTSRPFNLHLAFMRGFMTGAGVKTIDSALFESPVTEIAKAANLGWKAGKLALQIASKEAGELYGYTPSIIRTAGEAKED